MSFQEKLHGMWREIFSATCDLREIRRLQQQQVDLAIEDYLRINLFQHPRYADPRDLTTSEWMVYSQFGEDGIINEIFNRIGVTNRYFVEFGAGDGLENNSTYLLLQGWTGFWIEGNPTYATTLRANFASQINSGQLQLKQTLVFRDNIEALLTEASVPMEPDLLSIDIDGNDYWIWKAVQQYRPRTVVIEYNATYPPPVKWVMAHNPEYSHNQTSYFGASLKSLELLGREKGYCLVGCSFAGTNAFFVRQDLVAEHFLQPFTAENHYQPAKLFLLNRKNGHPRASFNPFEPV